MTLDPRAYLIDRFRGDAATLRARASAQRAVPAPRHGPDAAASDRMAVACDDIVARLETLPDDVAGQLDGLDALGPALRALADRAPDPFVRSVYGGAATRVVDIVTRERALAADDDASDDDDDVVEDDDSDDDTADDSDDVNEDAPDDDTSSHDRPNRAS